MTTLGPGRLRVRFVDPTGSVRAVDILMTPDEWDDIATVVWGSDELAAAWVKQRILDTEPRHRYLVHSICDLIPSETEFLPPNPRLERAKQAVRDRPQERGRWVVLDDDGNVVDEFR
ncbi:MULTISPECIES: hypothetical protein [unclassified Aeromicrobium]|uniref:hypothetical protein n=1 Tax=unclassified Aeromicrobium TaxID=2633570 RepID=UPI00396AFF4A